MFDFDATTGVVSNARDLPGFGNAWGCAFSPSNERLYLTKWYDNEVIQDVYKRQVLPPRNYGTGSRTAVVT